MRSFLPALLLLLCTSHAAALDLGATSVPVEDRSADARSEALARSLDQVLVRLTGRRSLADVPGVANVRDNPSRWARQYAYQVDEDGVLRLTAAFDVPALLTALERNEAPVWGTTRPEVLLWLAVQDVGGGEVLYRESESAVKPVLEQVAHERGLPLVLPSLDGTDGPVSAPDIRGNFDHVIHEASQRYDAPLRVTAVLYTAPRPSLRWRLFRQQDLLDQGELETEDTDAAIRQLVDQVTDRLASVYVVTPGDRQLVSLQVEGVDELVEWRALQTYLEQLSGVDQVRLQRLQGKVVTFTLGFGGSLAQLQRLLQLNPRLAPCVQVAEGEALGLPRYCWQSE